MSGPAPAAAHSPAGALPDPDAEIRVLAVAAVPGANFWTRRPVTRLDLAPGAYDEISSAQIPGFTERLVDAVPGLTGHRCSIGEPGGFVVRLRRGTYVPHIVEHVALELQTMAGHDVGYGRARGGDRPGEYTVVLAHRHSRVGERAAREAVELVRRLITGRPSHVGETVRSIREAAAEPEPRPAPTERVDVALTGGALAEDVARALHRRRPGLRVAASSPEALLRDGLPCASCRVAVITDGEVGSVPERYRDPERARQLLSVVAEGLPPGGVVVLPAGQWELQRELLERGWRVALFAGPDQAVDPRDARVAHALATSHDGGVVLECASDGVRSAERLGYAAPAAQAAAALAARMLEEDDAARP